MHISLRVFFGAFLRNIIRLHIFILFKPFFSAHRDWQALDKVEGQSVGQKGIEDWKGEEKKSKMKGAHIVRFKC